MRDEYILDTVRGQVVRDGPEISDQKTNVFFDFPSHCGTTTKPSEIDTASFRCGEDSQCGSEPTNSLPVST